MMERFPAGSRVKSIGLFVSIAAISAILGTFALLRTPLTEATHYWGGHQTQSSTVNWCYAENLPSDWKDWYFFSSMRWNASPSNWTLVRSSCNFFIGRMSFSASEYIEDDDAQGVTVTFHSGSYVLGGWSALNTDYTWTVMPWEGYTHCTGPAYCDIVTVAVHEMGHWTDLLDFGGGGCSASVMCPSTTTKWFITGHDSDSLISIYGQ